MKTNLYKVTFKTKDLDFNNHFYLVNSVNGANAIKWAKFLFEMKYKDISSTLWKAKRLLTNEAKSPYENMCIDVRYSY